MKQVISNSIWIMLLAMAAPLMLLLAQADHGSSAVTAAPAAANISCGDAISALLPCSGYLLGQEEGHPSAQCCRSAGALSGMAATVDARRQVCECFKETGPSFGVKPERARQLPQFCKLSISISITPNIDCSKIS